MEGIEQIYCSAELSERASDGSLHIYAFVHTFACCYRSGYAEDELSDDANDSPNGPATRTCDVETFDEDIKRDVIGYSGSAERRISQHSGRPFGGECLFDEDELSDAED